MKYPYPFLVLYDALFRIFFSKFGALVLVGFFCLIFFFMYELLFFLLLLCLTDPKRRSRNEKANDG